MIVDSQLVWARDPHEGYIRGRIIELGAQDIEIQPLNKKCPKRQCMLDEIFPACEKEDADHDDSCKYIEKELYFIESFTSTSYKF